MAKVPEFTRHTIPKLHSRPFHVRSRESRQKRGYDAQWDALSKWQLRNYPLCQKCEHEGLDVPAEVADHIIPLVDHGPRLDRANVWSLCTLCHNGWKRRLEEYARARGECESLIRWCRRLNSCPRV